jgi:phage shock protein PspC (stress-responsive transcriptional regulator)|tara:strand:+ start:1796 stop:2227 length:432 start_codon:yes stop_codon:yes gene_type:complete
VEIKKTSKLVIGGVCASISQKYNLRIVPLRIGAVLFTFFFWPLLLIYIGLWIAKAFKSKQAPIRNDDLVEIDYDLLAETRRAIKPSPAVMLVILFFGLSPAIGALIGGKELMALHWLTIATLPMAGIVLIIYLIIVYFISSRD